MRGVWHGDAAGLTVELLWSFLLRAMQPRQESGLCRPMPGGMPHACSRCFDSRLPIFVREKDSSRPTVSGSDFQFMVIYSFCVLFFVCGISEVLSSWRLVIKFKHAVNNVDSALNLGTGKFFQ